MNVPSARRLALIGELHIDFGGGDLIVDGDVDAVIIHLQPVGIGEDAGQRGDDLGLVTPTPTNKSTKTRKSGAVRFMG